MGWISEAGAVALGFAGLAFGWRERTSTLTHERTLADLEAVRSVIEEAAVHLHHATRRRRTPRSRTWVGATTRSPNA
jgi:hypothetical protein